MVRLGSCAYSRRPPTKAMGLARSGNRFLSVGDVRFTRLSLVVVRRQEWVGKVGRVGRGCLVGMGAMEWW
jgi:hypothetical protein